MKHPEEFSDAAVLRRSQKAAQELAVANRSAKVKRELDNARMDKKERRPLKEFTDFRTEIAEHVGVPAHSMPPNILILRRKTIRQFPNNVMVALYFNDKLGQYFSIPYGGVEADETVITPVALKEVLEPLEEEHLPGDTVRYLSGNNLHLQLGKVVSHDPTHLVVQRGKYHYKVPRTHVMHNDRTFRTGESGKASLREEELNEISIATASRAYHKRQNQGLTAMGKGDYSTALPLFKKSLKTHMLRSKKYEREDKGETVKEAEQHFNKSQSTAERMSNKPDFDVEKATKELNEDAISHLKKVVAFKTSTPLYHKDGTQTKIDPQTANALLTVHKSLHPDNQKKFADAVEHSKPQFARMLDFAWKQVR